MSSWHKLRQEYRFRRMAHSKAPIFVGPWRSEVGFETLYWLPWVSAWCERYKVPKERLIAISRGGAGVWYGTPQRLDLYDYAPVSRVRQAMLSDAAQSGSVKQQQITDWETAQLKVFAEHLGIRRYHVLHPSAMYRALTPWWEGHMSWQELVPQLAFEPIPMAPVPLDIALPQQFVAVSFYARHTWPLTDELHTWVAQLVDGIAKHVPVVVLESGVHTDEHVPFPLHGPNILNLSMSMTVTNHLAVQAAVLAKSQCFIGTYGGMMQLAVRLKKPAAGFFQKFEGTCYAHKQLTEWLGVQQQTPVLIGRPDDAQFVKEILQV